MSRSYKRIGGYGIAGDSDKWNRSRYHRDERRKVKRLLHEQLAYETSIWKPVEGTCCLYGDVCNVDDWWCDDPSKYIINYEEDSAPKGDFDHDCFMCRFSYWDKDYDCSEEPWEKIVMNKIDRSLGSADKYGWASDGGSYFHDNLSTMRQEFDKEVFGIPPYSWRHIRRGSGLFDLWDRYCDNREALHNKKHPQMIIRCEYKVKKACPLRGTSDWIDWKLAYGEVYNYYTRTIKVPYNKSHRYDTSLLLKGLDGDAVVERVYVYKHRDWMMRQIRSCRWDMGDYIIKLAPTTLHGPKDFIEWIRAHQEELILGAFRYRYGK